MWHRIPSAKKYSRDQIVGRYLHIVPITLLRIFGNAPFRLMIAVCVAQKHTRFITTDVSTHIQSNNHIEYTTTIFRTLAQYNVYIHVFNVCYKCKTTTKKHPANQLTVYLCAHQAENLTKTTTRYRVNIHQCLHLYTNR